MKQYKYNFILYLFLFIYFKDREKKQLFQKLLDTITIKNATTVTCKKKNVSQSFSYIGLRTIK